ncbi:unnamed protein product, partial [Gordionus sp. m RMFG-2023]
MWSTNCQTRQVRLMGKELLKDLCEVKKDGTSNIKDFFASRKLTKLKNQIYLRREWDKIVWNANFKDIFKNGIFLREYYLIILWLPIKPEYLSVESDLRVNLAISSSSGYIWRIDFSNPDRISEAFDLPNNIKYDEVVQDGKDMVLKKYDKDGKIVNITRYPNSLIYAVSNNYKLSGKTHKFKYVLKTCK